jgi:hypothetical protein
MGSIFSSHEVAHGIDAVSTQASIDGSEENCRQIPVEPDAKKTPAYKRFFAPSRAPNARRAS